MSKKPTPKGITSKLQKSKIKEKKNLKESEEKRTLPIEE